MAPRSAARLEADTAIFLMTRQDRSRETHRRVAPRRHVAHGLVHADVRLHTDDQNLLASPARFDRARHRGAEFELLERLELTESRLHRWMGVTQPFRVLLSHHDRKTERL